MTFPGVTQPDPWPIVSTGSDTAPVVAGHVQMLYLRDLRTGEVLYLTPSRGGIWLNDLDLGYPDIREVINPYPDAHGMIDETRYYGARAVTATFTCVASADPYGDVVTAAGWADLLRSWTTLDRSIKMVYQLLDQNVREIFLRPSTLGAPIIGNGVSRTTQTVTLGWKSPDGRLWALPMPSYTTDPARPDSYMVRVSGVHAGSGSGLNFNGTTGLNLNGATGVNFGGGSGDTANRVQIDPLTIGSVPVAPIIVIRNGCSQPRIYLTDRNGTVYSKFEFTTAVAGQTLTVQPSDVLVIDVAHRTAMLNPDAYGYGANVSKYLAPAVNWKSFMIRPQYDNVISYAPVVSNAGSVVEISYRQGFV